jgi:transaldolase
MISPNSLRQVPSISSLKVKLFADGADVDGILEMAELPYISGFTTNPTLMRKAGVTDYERFARELLTYVTDRPISFEVFSDELDEMERQARKIAAWGPNVYVKVPITNTHGRGVESLISRLVCAGVKVNVTALMTHAQVESIAAVLEPTVPAYVSLFAGRIADTGRDPIPAVEASVATLRDLPFAELIWASPRELLNVFQADTAGCHVITATNDILRKLAGVGKDLEAFSLETVKMFHDDAKAAGFTL